MSARGWFRFAAGALVVTGVCLPLGLILHPMPPFSDAVATSQWVVSHLFWYIGALAGIAGLAGLYFQQREDIGLLGVTGSSLAVVGLALIAGAMYFEAFIAPAVAARAPELFESFPSGGGWEGFLMGVLASGALFGMGFLVFGIAMFRAGRMPRWAILMAVLGGVPFAVNFLLPRPMAIVAVLALGIGLMAMGHTVWGERRTAGHRCDG